MDDGGIRAKGWVFAFGGISVLPEYLDGVRRGHADYKYVLDLPDAGSIKAKMIEGAARWYAWRVAAVDTLPRDAVGPVDLEAIKPKQGIGQPLGDLSPEAVLKAFQPLLWSRLKHYRVARIPECEQAAALGLLEALRIYPPALDVSVGYHATIIRAIDNAIKAEIRNKDTDALGRPGQVDLDASVRGQGSDFKDENGRDLCPYEFVPAEHQRFSDAIVHELEGALDKLGRWRPWSTEKISDVRSVWILETRGHPKLVKASRGFFKPLPLRAAHPHGEWLVREPGWIWDKRWVRTTVTRRATANPCCWYHQPRILHSRPRHNRAHDPEQLFRHRRVQEEIRLWPWLDGCALTPEGERAGAEWLKQVNAGQKAAEKFREEAIEQDKRQAARIDLDVTPRRHKNPEDRGFPSPMQYALPPLGRVVPLGSLPASWRARGPKLLGGWNPRARVPIEHNPRHVRLFVRKRRRPALGTMDDDFVQAQVNRRVRGRRLPEHHAGFGRVSVVTVITPRRREPSLDEWLAAA
jgi:hypothetical protein